MLSSTLSLLSDTISLSLIASAFLVLVLLHLLRTWNRHQNIPGPFLAKFTDLWRLLAVWRRDSHETYLQLHKKYGDLVRIGPNCIIVSMPDTINTIYGISVKAIKSDFYKPWQNIVNGKRTASLVFTTDEQQHATMKRPIASAYSLSTLVEFEPLLDSTTAVFLSRLDELFASTGKVCDLGTWLQWYAFDVIGELTFSKRLGFLEKATDVDGITASIGANFDRCSVLGQMPWLDEWTYKSFLYQKLFAKPISSPVLLFGQKLLQERQQSKDDQAPTAIDVNDPELSAKVLHGTIPSKPDFLSRFLKLHEEQPDLVTDRALLTYLFININAVSDTIGSTLRAIVYYLLKHRGTLTALEQELQQARDDGKLSIPLPTWTEVQRLPYLNAVIREGLRVNPALALPMERIAPAAGLKLGDTFMPPGTVVGINPWILHRDTRIFGPDADKWRPERWLDQGEAKTRYMDQHILTFGAGKRTCLGRNIAMLELTKLVPALVLRYDMRLAHPDREWKVFNSFAVRQEGLDVVFSTKAS